MKIALLALLFSAPSLAQAGQLSTATGDWSDIPLIAKRGQQSFSFYNMTRIDAALSGECKLREKRSDRFNLKVPFLVEFTPDGRVTQVVVQRINCPTAEQMIGSAVLDLARTGEFLPTGENQVGWYRGEFNLDSR